MNGAADVSRCLPLSSASYNCKKVNMWPLTKHKVILFVGLSQILIAWIFYCRNMLTTNASSPYGESEPRTTTSNESFRRFEGSRLRTPSRGDAFVGERSPSPQPTSTTMSPARKSYRASVAIGLGMTTRNSFPKDITRMPFFRSLMASFCKTASKGYDYRFFVAYDHDDPYLSKASFAARFVDEFAEFTRKNCPPSSAYAIQLDVCEHSRKPAWAQNDAMIEAYLAGMSYFYRINDDTVMKTNNWTERFIDTLERLTPPRIGVVGPTHSGGNTAILTYDFTHRTHIEIHGFYYPREFPDWYADRWITMSYKPGRSVKLPDIRLVHTMEKGQRYRTTRKTGPQVDQQIAKARGNILRYTIAKEDGFEEPDAKKVIAISLYNASSASTWGIVRNAQLMPVIYPGWTLHVYTSRRLIGKGPQYEAVKSGFVYDRLINTLELLGAKVIYVDDLDEKEYPPQLWGYLVVDRPEVDVLLIRTAEQRLSEREREVVKHWLQTKRSGVVHCIKDHRKHSNRTFIHGLWGAKSKELRQLLGESSMKQFIKLHAKRLNGSQSETVSHIEGVLYDKVKSSIVYYDSITCHRPGSRPFPVKREGSFYVGQKFDAHEQSVLKEEIDILSSTNPKCSGRS